MLASRLSTVLRQSLTTFAGRTECFYQNLEILKTLLEKTTSQDVNIHPQFMTDTLWILPNKAPVTYIDIYEDVSVTMGVFILKPNMRLPLHNHPQMYGLIKVLFGKLKITSYSLNTERTKEIDNSMMRQAPLNNFIIVEKTGETIVDSKSACCVLEPEAHNLHEIESIDGPAAFLDILSPPYDTLIMGNGLRKCSYYQVLSEIAPNIFQLKEVNAPSWYWTDNYPYTGPELAL